MKTILTHFQFLLRHGLVSSATPAGRRKIRRMEAAVTYLKERAERS